MSIKKTTTVGNKATVPPAKNSGPRLWWILGISLLALALFYIWYKRNASNKPDFELDKGKEPTLTAKNPRLQLLSADETGIDFENSIVETEQHNVIRYANQYNGSGLAIADINNDNLPDIYFVSTSGKNKLYLNQGNLKFKDITDSAGVGSEGGFKTAITAADVNADGWLDLYVCYAGLDKEGTRTSKLFINNHDLTFTEKAASFGLADKSPVTGINFFDYDLDGDLDCYLLNHPTDMAKFNLLRRKYAPDGKTLLPDISPRDLYDSDNFYRNDGGKFKEVSKQIGVQNLGFGLSAVVSDLDFDGWPDVYVANDYIQPDNFFLNNRKGGFSNEIEKHFKHCSMFSMGADLSDFDNDGRVDLFLMDMMPNKNYRQKSVIANLPLSTYLNIKQYGYFEVVTRNSLQRNNGNGTFSDIASLAGVFKTDWSWSGLLADLDNDGFKDLYVCNGYRREVTHRDYFDFLQPEALKKKAQSPNNDWQDLMDFIQEIPAYKVRNFVYQNKGDWKFEDKSGDWMTIPASWSNGGAWADLDLDGDLDLVVNNLEDPAFVYKNMTRETNSGNFLQAKLKGNPGNPFAVGASVLIEYQGQKQYAELYPTRGFFSSAEHLIHFGLGKLDKVDKLTVRWPDGKTQSFSNVPVNQRLQLSWTDASGYTPHLCLPENQAPALFTETPSAVSFAHKENRFNDFEHWPMRLWMESELGPLVATADVNMDGLDDFFVGNSSGSPSAIFIQNANGTFTASAQETFQKDAAYEDLGAVFFDADGDKDPDLLVTAGGSDVTKPSDAQVRLYINTGNGKFAKANFSPPLTDIAGSAAAFDYDGDGDEDLFVGGRLASASNWPMIPRSIVLQNDGSGRFREVTKQVAGEFESCGMVTDMVWTDLTGDGQPELVVVGEWMPVTIFEVKNKKLENVTARFGLNQTNGLWNTVSVADLDKDGDMDLVTGNMGLNTRFTASVDAPLLCYAKDFDRNETIDPVMAFPEDGIYYPLIQQPIMVKQMPSLKKKFLYASDYAKAPLNEIFSQKDLDSAYTTRCNELRTCWWENQGGKFVLHELPRQAQTAPVFGIVCADFNNDGFMDLLLAGNKSGFEPDSGACDAGVGTLLLGDGKGNFAWLDNMASGFWAMREVRDLSLLRGAGGTKLVVVANNNSGLQLYKNR